MMGDNYTNLTDNKRLIVGGIGENFNDMNRYLPKQQQQQQQQQRKRIKNNEYYKKTHD